MKDCIRICFISNNFWPRVGGAETQSERQARQLQALGNDVTVVTLQTYKHWKRTEMFAGLPIVRVGGIYKSNGPLRAGRLGIWMCCIAMFLTLWKLRHQYDVIHVFQATSLAAVAAMIGKITHKPVVISIQSTGPDEMQRKRIEQGAMLMSDTLTDTDFLKIDRSLNWILGGGDINLLYQFVLGGRIIVNFLRHAKVLYHINSSRSHSYLALHGFPAERFVRIPHGVDTEKFRPALEQRPDPAKPERDIICVARLEYAKGVDALLHAWGRMMHTPAEWRRHLKPRLRLVGDGRLKPQMERIVAELGIQESVEFLGLKTERDIVDLLQKSWGYMQPSRWESLPNALLEAMACGLPCIATRVSGTEDIILNGVNGLLVEPEQPAEMAEALRRIIEDSDLAEQLGRRGYATIIPDYQLTTVVNRFVELYRNLITRYKNGDGEAEWALLEAPSAGIFTQHQTSLSAVERKK